MECQVEKLEHFRHILLFEFNRGAKAAEAARSICAVFEDNVIDENTARKCDEEKFILRRTPRVFNHGSRLYLMIEINNKNV